MRSIALTCLAIVVVIVAAASLWPAGGPEWPPVTPYERETSKPIPEVPFRMPTSEQPDFLCKFAGEWKCEIQQPQTDPIEVRDG